MCIRDRSAGASEDESAKETNKEDVPTEEETTPDEKKTTSDEEVDTQEGDGEHSVTGTSNPVSYTHLDVYKRQVHGRYDAKQKFHGHYTFK